MNRLHYKIKLPDHERTTCGVAGDATAVLADVTCQRCLKLAKQVGVKLVGGRGKYDPSVLSVKSAPYLPRLYSLWVDLFTRTSAAYWKRLPSYEGTFVAPGFIHFSDFADWAVKQVGWDKPGYQLDKDILRRGNRAYGPDTCVFVPLAVNSLLTKPIKRRNDLPIGARRNKGSDVLSVSLSINGRKQYIGRFKSTADAFTAYKQAKESEIKRVAELWKSQIDPRAYAALMAYEVLPTD